jgi:DNA-binding SARP family transcriptional activator
LTFFKPFPTFSYRHYPVHTRVTPSASKTSKKHKLARNIVNSILHIKLLGDFHVSQNGKPIPDTHSIRLQSLLSYMVLHRDTPQSRQYLAFTFWPDSSESQALTNLRQVIHHLRRAIPDIDTYLIVDSRNVAWNPDAPCILDIVEFERFVQQAEGTRGNDLTFTAVKDLENAVELYRGDLFPQCYSAWIEPFRMKLKDEYIDTLCRLIEYYENRREYRSAIHYAERLLISDNLREKTYLDLMRLHALNDDRASALRVYRDCAKILKRELEVEPDESIKKLYDRLVQNEQRTDIGADEKKTKDDDLLPLIGRQQEWVRLKELWNHTSEGPAFLAIISGEAGIGKTRLAMEMVRWVSRQNYATASARSYAAESTLAYMPVSEWLRSENIKRHLVDLDKVFLSEVARLLPELLIEFEELSPPKPITDNLQRKFFFDAISRVFSLSEKPLLLFIDDLQWCDRETLEWIHFLIHSGSGESVFILGTVRIEEVDSGHPLHQIVQSLIRSNQVAEIELSSLSAFDTGQLAEQVYGEGLTEELRTDLFNTSEGNPLFLIETIQSLIENGDRGVSGDMHSPYLPHSPKDNYSLLPDKVKSIIKSRLQKVSPVAQKIAYYGSVIGRNFSKEILHAISDFKENELISAIDELLHRRLFREREEGGFDFSHDKIREVSYASMNQVERSVVHGKIARILDTINGAKTYTISSQLAFHYDLAGNSDEALRYYEHAAGLAQQMYALHEAVKLHRRALELVAAYPESEDRDRRELAIRLLLGPLNVMVWGYHVKEVTENYDRIHFLSTRLGQEVSAPVLRTMAISRIIRGNLEEPLELGYRLLEAAKREKQSVLTVEGHYVAGVSNFWLGNLLKSRDHLIAAIEAFDPDALQMHIDHYAQHPRVICESRLAHTLWHLGFPEQAEEHFRHAVDEARTYGHPFSLTYVLMFGFLIMGETGDLDSAMALNRECITISREKGIELFHAKADFYRNWLLFQSDPDASLIEEMQYRLKRMQDEGIQLDSPYYTNLITRALLERNETEEALRLSDRALEFVKERGEVWHQAEILRIRGNILFAAGEKYEDTEKYYLDSLKTAQKQKALMYELRAACRLARLWHKHYKTEEAVDLLTDVYNRFTEGGNTSDLRTASELLERLNRGIHSSPM